jgi:DNA-binding PadR family transcriptional regulator
MTAEAAEDIVRSLDGLDKLLEHRLRLALCVLLTRFESMSFSRLKKLTGETDGNLGANLRKLEDARYVRVKKMHVARKPVSWYTLTALGRKALRRHLDALSDVIGRVGA